MLSKCLICHKDIASSFLLANSKICKQCFKNFKIINERILIDDVKCLILYEYNDFMKSLIVNIKGYKDIELAQVFLQPFKNILKTLYKNYEIVPIPSSSKSDLKRGFNHVEEIFKVLDLPINHLFKKRTNYKQSSQHKIGRLNIFKEIIYIKNYLPKSTKILLVDDITTTNSSLRICIKLLRENGFSNISCLVIANKKK